jgi:CHAP domain
MANILKSLDKKVLLISTTGIIATSLLLFSKTEKKRTQERIIKIAESYVGQKEIAPNKGFYDKKFEAEMKAVGFQIDYQWCALFVKLVILKAFYNNTYRFELLKKKMNASTQLTFKYFLQNKGFWKVSTKPKVGAIINWQKISEPSKGHFGIVYKVSGNTFYSIEGNKNNQVSIVKHSLSELNITSGIKLLGFVEFT